MHSPLSSSITSDPTTALHVSPPTWVLELLRGSRQRISADCDPLAVQLQESDDFTLLTICLPRARQLTAGEFESTVAQIYHVIQQQLQGRPACHPVRVWNHLPAIHAPGNDGTDRYMSFNAGRFRAYSEWFGGAAAFDHKLPSASAVGHDGADLVIHALGARFPGIAIANPRQIAPHHYSRRFGPLPPCFARATVLAAGAGQPRQILVGGTASIRGENSIHHGDLAQQMAETFDNLACLIRAASGSAGVNGMTPAEATGRLALFRDVRIYYVHQADHPVVEALARRAFPESCRIEYLQAELCRTDLLVEIEGRADVK